ncbi:MAG: formate dehydrogenase accessory protein FdhE [Acidobacteria bacterium]|nr:formate dehydrogenase accessory protein FdhE [Acidobacteriota bacterium]
MPPPEHPRRPVRAQPREIVELKQIKLAQPELSAAVDLQVELLELQRRLQARLPLPWVEVDPRWLAEEQKLGRPLIRLKDLRLQWSDVRLMIRQTADVLRRFEMLQFDDHTRIQHLVHEGHQIEPIVAYWYTAQAFPDDRAPKPPPPDPPIDAEALDLVLQLAMRPFLARCAEVMLPQIDVSAWTRARCPLCGGDPEMATLTSSGDRQLICGRCLGGWSFSAGRCPFCYNDDRTQKSTFTGREPQYRIEACNVCRRYIKTYDVRKGTRPFMLAVDSVATLPLDAAAIQKGYIGG